VINSLSVIGSNNNFGPFDKKLQPIKNQQSKQSVVQRLTSNFQFELAELPKASRQIYVSEISTLFVADGC
jgi:hypothetical protein